MLLKFDYQEIDYCLQQATFYSSKPKTQIEILQHLVFFSLVRSDVWHSLSSDYAPTTVVSDEKSASSVAVIDSIDDLKQHLNIAVESTQNDKKSSFVVRIAMSRLCSPVWLWL